MSIFGDLFNPDGDGDLPDWLQSGAAIVEEGLDLYDRIAQGGSTPHPPPMQSQSAAPSSPYGVTPAILLVGLAVLLIFASGKK